jgi:hypothetical protein
VLSISFHRRVEETHFCITAIHNQGLSSAAFHRGVMRRSSRLSKQPVLSSFASVDSHSHGNVPLSPLAFTSPHVNIASPKQSSIITRSDAEHTPSNYVSAIPFALMKENIPMATTQTRSSPRTRDRSTFVPTSKAPGYESFFNTIHKAPPTSYESLWSSKVTQSSSSRILIASSRVDALIAMACIPSC